MRLETLHPKALGTPTEVPFFFGCTGLVVQAAGLVTVYGWAVAGCAVVGRCVAILLRDHVKIEKLAIWLTLAWATPPKVSQLFFSSQDP